MNNNAGTYFQLRVEQPICEICATDGLNCFYWPAEPKLAAQGKADGI